MTTEDARLLRVALSACRIAGLDHAVIHEGMVRSLHDARVSAIISELRLSIDPELKLGIMRLSELEKRLSLFGDDVLIEGEVTGDKKIRKLMVRGKAGRIEFRCTDVSLLDRKYPRSSNDQPKAVVTISKAEASLLSKGVRTLGAEQLHLQVKKDGQVRLESVDSSSDRFELELTAPAEFVDEAFTFVRPYITGTNGALLPLIEHAIKDQDQLSMVLMNTGNLSLTVAGHSMIAIPKITT